MEVTNLSGDAPDSAHLNILRTPIGVGILVRINY